jgi:dihydrofolate synthase/folylpolyglutamate synthase
VTIKNLTEATRILRSYANRDPKAIGRNFTLERVYPLMEAAGNPQDRLKVVHIAGTSGKTSTAYFMAALLKASGKKIGTTVSPHVDSVTERIQINGVPISDGEFCGQLGEFIEIVERAGQHPSYFEMLYAFSLWVFERKKVDYAVLETGLGGLYDATNVAKRQDKVCVITDIGLDHTSILGNSLAEIATQKIGIVHERNAVFMYDQPAEVMEVVRKWTDEKQAALTIVEEQDPNGSGIADYQQRNWLLAYNVYWYLEKRDNLKHLTRQVLEKTREVQVPGRMDVRSVKGKIIVMDGAHNRQKMETFIDSFRKLYPGIKPAILLAMKRTKDHDDIAPILVPFASRFVVTSFDSSQDNKLMSTDPELIADTLRNAGARSVAVFPDQEKAFKALLDSPENVCVITGSFYLLGLIRNNEHLA